MERKNSQFALYENFFVKTINIIFMWSLLLCKIKALEKIQSYEDASFLDPEINQSTN